MELKLKDFKLVKNIQKPDMCFSYVARIEGVKYSIFTMNYGKTYLASIEERRMDGRYYGEFNKHSCLSLEEALEAINNELKK